MVKGFKGFLANVLANDHANAKADSQKNAAF